MNSMHRKERDKTNTLKSCFNGLIYGILTCVPATIRQVGDPFFILLVIANKGHNLVGDLLENMRGKGEVMVFSNALYLPHLETNILRLSKLYDQRYKIALSGSFLTIHEAY